MTLRAVDGDHTDGNADVCRISGAGEGSLWKLGNGFNGLGREGRSLVLVLEGFLVSGMDLYGVREGQTGGTEREDH